MPAHVLQYRPDAAAQLDYLIVSQCSFILRAVEDVRGVSISHSEQGRSEVEMLISKSSFLNQQKMGELQTQQLRDHFLSGLLVHLRSIPIGMRVDAWIQGQFPQLLSMQSVLAARQLQENQGVLAESVRQWIPPRIFDATAAINAAFAVFWSELLGDDKLLLPYRASGYEQKGRQLKMIFDQVPDSATHDRQLVDQWGEALNLKTWYKWIDNNQ